jgi:hypothetical protein
MEIPEGKYRVFTDEQWLTPHTDTEISEFFKLQSPENNILTEDVQAYLKSVMIPVFEKLPTVSKEMLMIYKRKIHRYKLFPGIMKSYAVGGRVKGSQLKVGSDIDIVFAGTHPDQMIEQPEGVWTTQLQWNYEIDKLQDELIEEFKTLCTQIKVPYIFHIVNFGASIPERQREHSPLYLLAE